MLNNIKLITMIHTTSQAFNAGSKAVEDVITTCRNHGAKIKTMLLIKKPNDFLNRFSWLVKTLSVAFFGISGRDKVVIQYSQATRYNRLLLKILKRRGISRTLLIHDINSLRSEGEINTTEREMFRLASSLIVHTDSMRRYLINAGITTPSTVLEIFDYHKRYSGCNTEVNDKRNRVIFAGNLAKSIFLSKLNDEYEKSRENSVDFNLYGAEPTDMEWGKQFHYKGKFKADNVDEIKGDWGLVWDGESLDGCCGNSGEYLRYISPHKLSLYLVSGHPVIIWEESAMSDFVLKYGVGITIRSLRDIPKALSSIDAGAYSQLAENATKLSASLDKGRFFLKAIENIE